jgi:16S rRNA (guanine527-N7)-methyltransferase
MEKASKKLELIARYFGDVTEKQWNQLETLDPLYREWNEKINVISRKDIDSLYEKHILHSLSIAAAFHFSPGSRIIDIGTGGGFPGVPLAIFFPESEFFLVDSVGKKIKVVDAVKEGAGLTNITTINKRAEDIRDLKFDCVLSRAVAPLKDLWNWSKPLLNKKKASFIPVNDALDDPHGLICLKGGSLANEIAESGCRPRMMEIFDLFAEPYFKEKFLLYIHKP